MSIVHYTPPDSPPLFSFADTGIRRAIAAFAADWSDAQAAEDWLTGQVVDAAELNGQGRIEARAILSRGEAQTDDASAFEDHFAPAWADAYVARLVAAEARGW
jgi:hypothetical protein